tara:strand:- start:7718 stop:8110 length:393 start_codon:yes stop_codon:yes gene_type:complete
MKIYDKSQNLLAIVIKKGISKEEKDFHTDDSSEFQLGTFNLKKDTVIERHYHQKQERKIYSTNEVLVLQEGKMVITIYDSDLDKVEDITLESGDMVALFDGGHEIKIEEDSNFIEVKQGPYIEGQDKTRF